MPNNDRYVVRHPDGWAVKKPGGEKPSSVHRTQAEAEARAKEIVGAYFAHRDHPARHRDHLARAS